MVNGEEHKPLEGCGKQSLGKVKVGNGRDRTGTRPAIAHSHGRLPKGPSGGNLDAELRKSLDARCPQIMVDSSVMFSSHVLLILVLVKPNSALNGSLMVWMPV